MKMKWLSGHHWIVVCFQASVLSVVVQLPGPVQSQNLDYSSWSPVKEDQIAQRRSDFFDGEIRETRSLKDRPREGRDGSSEAEPTTEGSTYFLPQGSSQAKQSKKRQAVNEHSSSGASKKQLNLSKEVGDGPAKKQGERDVHGYVHGSHHLPPHPAHHAPHHAPHGPTHHPAHPHPPLAHHAETPPAECFIETPCTRSCGDGFKLLLPNPDGYGCYGASLQVHPCNEKPCPIDCHWGSWGPWTQCSVTGRRKRYAEPEADASPEVIAVLGDPHHPIVPEALISHRHGGHICTQSRQRVIEVPASFYGKECHGDYAESRYCQSY